MVLLMINIANIVKIPAYAMLSIGSSPSPNKALHSTNFPLRSTAGERGDWRQVAKGPINSPTVLNSSLNVAQFWDGRAKDLKEQAGGPIANPGEMAFSHDLAVDMLRSIPQYVAEFKKCLAMTS